MMNGSEETLTKQMQLSYTDFLRSTLIKLEKNY